MNICQEMHQTVVRESLRYKEEQGRYNYVTPTSYLELLSIFSKIFGLKKNQMIQAKKRTKNGLDKVIMAFLIEPNNYTLFYYVCLIFSFYQQKKKYQSYKLN